MTTQTGTYYAKDLLLWMDGVQACVRFAIFFLEVRGPMQHTHMAFVSKCKPVLSSVWELGTEVETLPPSNAIKSALCWRKVGVQLRALFPIVL